MQTATGATIDGKRVLALIAALALGVFFWDSPVLLPIKLLVVAMHESGHALASLIVGGHVQEIVISADQSGHTLSATGIGFFRQVIVYSGGYVGSSIAGALLIILTFRFKASRAVLWMMTFWLAVVAVVYSGDWFTRLFCVGMAIVLGGLARFLAKSALELLNLFLAAFTALYALFDLRSDLWSGNRVGTDAYLLSQITWIPSVIWAAIWSLASVVILALAIYWSVHTAKRQRPGATALPLPPLALRR